MHFKIGDMVVYPNQGVGEIRDVFSQDIMGRKEKFYKLRILANDSIVMIPITNVENVGLRRLSSEKDLKSLFLTLESNSFEGEQDWKNRYKENVEKMKTGSIVEVGEVLQNLYFLSFAKPLSFREKKMYDRARQLVISEISTVRGESEGDVEQSVDTMLSSAYERHSETEVLG